MPPAKATHDLHLSRSAEDLIARLSRRSIDLNKVLAPYVADLMRYGIVVAGSIADGVGTARSDVDILVLAEGAAEALSQGPMEVRRRWSAEWLIYEHGIEFNIELVTRSAMGEGLSAFLGIAPLLYDPRGVKTLPILSEEAMELLHRLRSGWPVCGEDLVANWRDEFMVTILPLYAALYHYVAHLEALEDARALAGDDDGSFCLAAGESARSGIVSMLALAGVTNQSRKWSVRLARHSLAPRHSAWLEQVLPLMFLPGDLNDTDCAIVLGRLSKIGTYLREQIDKDLDLGRGATMILDQIHYTT